MLPLPTSSRMWWQMKEWASQFLLQKSIYIKCWSGVTGHDIKVYPHHIIWEFRLPVIKALRNSISYCLSSSCWQLVPSSFAVLHGSVTMSGRRSTFCFPSSGSRLPFQWTTRLVLLAYELRISTAIAFLLGLHGYPDWWPIDGQLRNRNSKISNENTKMI